MKILRKYVFRAIIGGIILVATVVFPLYFMLPNLEGSNRIFLVITVVVAAALELSLIIVINYNMLVKPIKIINETSRKLSNGDYDAHIEIKRADYEVDMLSRNMNNIANEFENLERMRKSFVANASHELRSPLTSMQGFLQAMLDGTIVSDADREKYLKIVHGETKRLSSLINSMLDLSRMESGKNPISPTRFEINSVIRQVVERLEPNLVKKEVQLDIDFARSASYVYADKDKIIQVLINLIDNAIKYSPAYSRILITTHIHGRKIYVAVKDKGFGISKKDQILIWDRFYMADKARTPVKGKGTGLGLSIVKKIIDEHKEVIWVESSKGAGATFIFTLTLFDPNKHKIENGAVLQNGSEEVK